MKSKLAVTCTVDSEIEMVSIVVKRPWPTKSMVLVTKLILISLNLSTENTRETKNHLLAPLITEIEIVSIVVKRPWPTRSTVQMKNNLSSMSASILVVVIADNCIFLLVRRVTLGQSEWSVSKHIKMHIFGKVVSYGPFETLGRSASQSNDFYTKNSKDWLWGPIRGVLSGPQVGLVLIVENGR